MSNTSRSERTGNPAFDPRDQRLYQLLEQNQGITGFTALTYDSDGKVDLTLRTAEDIYKENKAYYNAIGMNSGRELRDFADKNQPATDLNDPDFGTNNVFWNTLVEQVNDHYLNKTKSWGFIVPPENVGVKASQLDNHKIELVSNSVAQIAERWQNHPNSALVVAGIYEDHSNVPEIGESPKALTSNADRRDILLGEAVTAEEKQARADQFKGTVLDMSNYLGVTGADMITMGLLNNPELLDKPFSEAWSQLNPSSLGEEGRVANAYLKPEILRDRIAEDFKNSKPEDMTLGEAMRHIISRDVPEPVVIIPVAGVPKAAVSPDLKPELAPEEPPVVAALPVEEILSDSTDASVSLYYDNTHTPLGVLPGQASLLTQEGYGVRGDFPVGNNGASVSWSIGHENGSLEQQSTGMRSLGTTTIDLPQGYGLYNNTTNGAQIFGAPGQEHLGDFTAVDSINLSPGDIGFNRGGNYDAITATLGGKFNVTEDMLASVQGGIARGDNYEENSLLGSLTTQFESGNKLTVGARIYETKMRVNTGHLVNNTPQTAHVVNEGVASIDPEGKLNVEETVKHGEIQYTDHEITPQVQDLKTVSGELPFVEPIRICIDIVDDKGKVIDVVNATVGGTGTLTLDEDNNPVEQGENGTEYTTVTRDENGNPVVGMFVRGEQIGTWTYEVDENGKINTSNRVTGLDGETYANITVNRSGDPFVSQLPNAENLLAPDPGGNHPVLTDEIITVEKDVPVKDAEGHQIYDLANTTITTIPTTEGELNYDRYNLGLNDDLSVGDGGTGDEITTQGGKIFANLETSDGWNFGGWATHEKTKAPDIHYEGSATFTSINSQSQTTPATLDPNASDILITNNMGDIIGINQGNGQINPGSTNSSTNTVTENIGFSGSYTDIESKRTAIGGSVGKMLDHNDVYIQGSLEVGKVESRGMFTSQYNGQTVDQMSISQDFNYQTAGASAVFPLNNKGDMTLKTGATYTNISGSDNDAWGVTVQFKKLF